jgi:hypothetical protein
MRRRRKHEARHLILKADTPHPHPLARNKSSSWTRRDMMNHTSPRAPASLDPWQRDVSCVDVRAVGMAIRGELAFGRGSIAHARWRRFRAVECLSLHPQLPS